MALNHARSGEVVHLGPLGPALNESITAAIIKSERFEAMRLVIREGMEIPIHAVAGNITLHCLEGLVELGLKRGPLELAAGDWVYLDAGEAHSLKGLKHSALLMTVIFNT